MKTKLVLTIHIVELGLRSLTRNILVIEHALRKTR